MELQAVLDDIQEKDFHVLLRRERDAGGGTVYVPKGIILNGMVLFYDHFGNCLIPPVREAYNQVIP